ncbi:MAG: hypothetical protein E7639_04310 [Ruminococcaceae bacterium]|nr:hypothetical protein [Oscillospiraceae bacterium]
MKRLRNILTLLCVLSLTLIAFTACGEKESLKLSADKTTAKHGEVVVFSTVHVTKKGEAATDAVSYEITAGAESATLEGNKLTILDTAANGATVTVVSKMNDMISNEMTVTVTVPENSISISVDKAEAQRNEIVTVTVDLREDGQSIAADDAVLSITDGADAATLVGTQLTIAADAANGTVIRLCATYKGLTSNVATVTVRVPVTGITASASKAFVPSGSYATLQRTLSPTGAVGTVEWVITEGASLCAVSGDLLIINDDAANGATIKLKAVCGTVESNELVFTVGEEEETFLLLLSQNALTVDRNGATATVLDVEVLNRDLQPVTDRAVSFELISGAELLTLTPDGNTCTFTALGHGDAVLRVSLNGTNISKTASIKVIVPPDAVTLPTVFAERQGLIYNVSMIAPGTGLADRLPFAAGVVGTNVCSTLKYSFSHADGTTGDEVATWADGKITFKKQGRVTVTVSSDSGSRNEVSASYTFAVNAGYNVSTFSELKALLEGAAYNGDIVNIVVTEKPVGAGDYVYGYDIVPDAALKPVAEQTWQEVLWNSHIRVINKNVYLNGNNHKIDGSQLRVITKAELDTLNGQGYSLDNISALLAIAPESSDQMQIAGRQHSVKIYDLEIVGNTPIDFSGDLNAHRPLGSYNTGLQIGDVYYQVVYHLEMRDVTVSRCNVGLRFRRTISDSTVDNITVYNCFSNGVETEASIMTFGDMTFGKCGAAGLEMVPSNSNGAGDAMNQRQKITFAGVIDTTQNLNNGQTKYLSVYGADGLTVPMILQGVLAEYQSSPATMSHMMNEEGEFGFVTFIFHDFMTGTVNVSEAAYPGYQQGGIINVKDLPKDGSIDTTHEYILLEVAIADRGLNLGYALLYNHNYRAN